MKNANLKRATICDSGNLNPIYDEIFKGLPNYYYTKLADLLCSDKDDFNFFLNEFYDPDNVTRSLRRFRKFILDHRSEESEQECLKLMQEQIHNQDWNNLHSILRELFLEPFDKWIMDRVVKLIEQGLTAEDIFKWKRKNKNIKSIISFSIEYIKN